MMADIGSQTRLVELDLSSCPWVRSSSLCQLSQLTRLTYLNISDRSPGRFRVDGRSLNFEDPGAVGDGAAEEGAAAGGEGSWAGASGAADDGTWPWSDRGDGLRALASMTQLCHLSVAGRGLYWESEHLGYALASLLQLRTLNVAEWAETTGEDPQRAQRRTCSPDPEPWGWCLQPTPSARAPSPAGAVEALSRLPRLSELCVSDSDLDSLPALGALCLCLRRLRVLRCGPTDFAYLEGKVSCCTRRGTPRRIAMWRAGFRADPDPCHASWHVGHKRRSRVRFRPSSLPERVPL